MRNPLVNHKYNKTNATMVAYSQNEQGATIATMLVTFPRFILAELNTHRVLSKNSASSRAIPFKKMLKMVIENPFVPMAFQKDHKGMQGNQYLDAKAKYSFSDFIGYVQEIFDALEEENVGGRQLDELLASIRDQYTGQVRTLEEWWLQARDRAVESAILLYSMRVTKQLCNRLLEPFMWHTVLLTGTDWNNFFELRCPRYQMTATETTFSKKLAIDRATMLDFEDDPMYEIAESDTMGWLKINRGMAEIHMMELAESVFEALRTSRPRKLQPLEWHIPFAPSNTEVTDFLDNKVFKNEADFNKAIEGVRLKVATARCARTSYLNFDQKDDFQADFNIFNKLLKADPVHASPGEHCARAMTNKEYDDNLVIEDGETRTGRLRNFTGFTQLRVMVENGTFNDYEKVL